MSIVGTRVVRVEDPRLLSTGGVYTEDLRDPRLADALYLTFVRSPVAHARILSIDTAAAAAGARRSRRAHGRGPRAGLGPADDARLSTRLWPCPCWRPTSSAIVGEPVAVVLTEQAYQGEDAAELVSVEYEPLPAVVDIARRGRATTCCCSRRPGTNTVCTFEARRPRSRTCSPAARSLSPKRSTTSVSPSRRWRAAPRRWCLMTDGRLTMWLSTQAAQGTRRVRWRRGWACPWSRCE